MAFLQWFFLPALAAIGANVKRPTQAITAAEVSQWATSDQLHYPVGIADLALSSLQKHGYVESRALKPQRSRSPRLWFATATGLQVAQAAVQAMPGATPDLQALPTRVWNLLRIRKRLTSEEAATTLIDAGAADFVVQKKRGGDLRQIVVLLLINAALGFFIPNIAWQAHLGGLIAGALCTVAIAYAPAKNRNLIQWGGIAAVVVVLIGLTLYKVSTFPTFILG